MPQLAFPLDSHPGDLMDLDDEILSRIRAAKTWDKEAKPGDFQVRVAENGSVLVNLRTGRAQLVYDDDSKLHDVDDLCPTLSKGAKPLNE
jgi:hypothetical protein